MLPVVGLQVELDPTTWWDRYGHRLEARDPTGQQDERGGGTGMAGPMGPSYPQPESQFDGPPPSSAPGSSGPKTASELSSESILRARSDEPVGGWRRTILRMTGGLLNPGPSPQELRERAVLHRIRRPLLQSHRIAVTSIKGGVGKTTVSTLLGLVMAENRGDRVVVLDANPDAGTLADRLTGESNITVRELLRDLGHINTWTEISRYTSLAGRLQVLASEQDPAAGDAFSREEYEHICAL